MDLWRGIETQLTYVGVTLEIDEVKSEKEIFGPLLKTNQGENEVQWDLLVWGNDDWFFNHPFTAFLVYRTHNVWSTIFPDPVLDGYIEEMFQASVEDPMFDEITYRDREARLRPGLHVVRADAQQRVCRQQGSRFQALPNGLFSALEDPDH